MRVFVAEWLVAGMGQEELVRLQSAAVRACRQFETEGRPVRYLRSLYVPGDGRCLCLFEAPCAARVRDVNEAGQLPFARILEAWEM
jgi:Nickel responsive protein SCO4226-like